MSTSGYTPEHRLPTPEEYVGLRDLAGLSPMTLEAARIGLPNSVAALTLRKDGLLVGMGRVIGDGGMFFQVVDVAVHPDHQRRGLGRIIMQNLMEQLKAAAPAGAYVSLIADDGADRLYREYGFTPTAPRSIGMSLFLIPED